LLPLTRRLPATRRQLPAWIVLSVIVSADIAKAGWYFADLSYTVAHAAQELTDLSSRLPSESRVILGDTADTLGLGTDAFTFIIRHWEHNQMFMNLDGWQRFQPNIVLSPHVQSGFVKVSEWRVAPDRHGQPRVVIPVYVRQSMLAGHGPVP
jgi:hypothetical protein